MRGKTECLWQEKQKKGLLYQDYITWPDDERWKLIDGVPYSMIPAPTF